MTKRRVPLLPETVQDDANRRNDKKPRSNPHPMIFVMMKRRALSSQRALRRLLLEAFLCTVVVCLILTRRSLHSIQREHKYPITIHVNGDNLFRHVTSLALTNYPHHLITLDRRNHYWIHRGARWHKQPASNNNNDDDEEEENNDNDSSCQPMGDWQTERNILSCNLFHEVDLLAPTLLNVGAGTFRDAWAFQEYDGTKQVLKTLVWNDELDWDEFDEARKEAMAMAQLSWSNYVANIYGYCSHSTIMDYSEDGILWWLFDDFDPTKEELLKIAHDVTAGVADAQNVSS